MIDMIPVETSCPVCGDVTVSSDRIRLVLHPGVQGLAFYSFTCPCCHDEVRKPASPQVVRLLRAGGILPEIRDFPAEAAEEHHGPALTHDDLLDFATWLNSTQDIAAAAMPTRKR